MEWGRVLVGAKLYLSTRQTAARKDTCGVGKIARGASFGEVESARDSENSGSPGFPETPNNGSGGRGGGTEYHSSAEVPCTGTALFVLLLWYCPSN